MKLPDTECRLALNNHKRLPATPTGSSRRIYRWPRPATYQIAWRECSSGDSHLFPAQICPRSVSAGGSLLCVVSSLLWVVLHFPLSLYVDDPMAFHRNGFLSFLDTPGSHGFHRSDLPIQPPDSNRSTIGLTHGWWILTMRLSHRWLLSSNICFCCSYRCGITQ